MARSRQTKFVMEIKLKNNMETPIFTPWYPADFRMTSRVSFEGIVYGINGMRIDLREEHGEKRFLSLNFSDLPTAVRIADEGLRFPLLPKNIQNSFYLVQNSEFLAWLNRESLNIHKNDSIFHLAIVTDEWIDLLCNDKPTISIAR
jgi:hypothetical protein